MSQLITRFELAALGDAELHALYRDLFNALVRSAEHHKAELEALLQQAKEELARLHANMARLQRERLLFDRNVLVVTAVNLCAFSVRKTAAKPALPLPPCFPHVRWGEALN